MPWYSDHSFKAWCYARQRGSVVMRTFICKRTAELEAMLARCVVQESVVWTVGVRVSG